MTDNKQRALGGISLILGLLFSLVAYTFWEYFQGRTPNLFYKSVSLSFLFYTTALKLGIPQNIFFDKVKQVVVVLSLNATLDEFLFDPREFNLNEYVFCGYIVLQIFITKEKMKEFYKELVDIVILTSPGLIGGFIRGYSETKGKGKNKKQIFASVAINGLIGGAVAYFVNPIIVDYFSLDLKWAGFSGFMVGFGGLEIVAAILPTILNQLKKWQIKK